MIAGWTLTSFTAQIRDLRGVHARVKRWIEACCDTCPEAVFDLRLLSDADGVRVALLMRHESPELVFSVVNLLGIHWSEFEWRAMTAPEINQWCTRAVGGDVILLERAAAMPAQFDTNWLARLDYVPPLPWVVAALAHGTQDWRLLADALRGCSSPMVISVRFKATRVSSHELEFADRQCEDLEYLRDKLSRPAVQAKIDLVDQVVKAWRTNLAASTLQVTLTVASQGLIDERVLQALLVGRSAALEVIALGAKERDAALLRLQRVECVAPLLSEAPLGLERLGQLYSAGELASLAPLMSDVASNIDVGWNPNSDQRVTTRKRSLLVATDPQSAAGELLALEQHHRPEVREALVRHPNAPLELLRGALGAAHPQALLENPIFDLLMLEQADLTLWPVETLEALIRIGYLPSALRELALVFPSFDLRRALSDHAQLSAAEIRGLLSERAHEDSAMLRVHPSISWWQRERPSWHAHMRISTQFLESRTALLPVLLRQPQFPVDQLMMLITHEYAAVRAAVAQHAQLPSHILVKWLFDHDATVFAAARARRDLAAALELYTRTFTIGKHRRVTPELRYALIAHAVPARVSLYGCANARHPAVRFAVARHPHSDARTLARVAEEFSVDVYSAVLGHPNSDAATLRHIYLYLNAASASAMLELADPASLEARRLMVLLEAYAYSGIKADDVATLLYVLRDDV